MMENKKSTITNLNLLVSFGALVVWLTIWAFTKSIADDNKYHPPIRVECDLSIECQPYMIIECDLSTDCDTSIYDLVQIAKIISFIESDYGVNTKGDKEDGVYKAFGIMQIHQGCITDVNKVYGTNYIHDDAMDELISMDIFEKYIGIGINEYRKNHNKYPSEEDIVRMWNGGAYRGYTYDSTLPYLKRYTDAKNKLENSSGCLL